MSTAYPTVCFRLDRAAYAALGLGADRKGLSPNGFAKAALAKALAETLHEIADETAALTSPITSPRDTNREEDEAASNPQPSLENVA